MTKNKIGLYIHVPYCKFRCHFCSFYLVPGVKTRVDKYFECVKHEIHIYKPQLKNYQIKTIYFGGGTPSYVESTQIVDVLNYILENLDVCDDAEITIEGSPDSLTIDKLADFKQAGINRLSMGLQAWQGEMLKYIGRSHRIGTFLETYKNARDIGFENINVDLMYSFPKLTFAQWEETLTNVINLEPEHISAYSLIVDEESTFGKLQRLGKFKQVSETTDRKMNRMARRVLRKAGYIDYEIANFAKPGFESKHNSAMWLDNDYIGIGASAAGRFKGYTYTNIMSLEQYIRSLEQNKLAFQEREKQDLEGLKLLHIILNLRLKKGVSFERFKQKFNIDFASHYRTQIDNLIKNKLIKLTKEGITLTVKGRDLENIVDLEFV